MATRRTVEIPDTDLAELTGQIAEIDRSAGVMEDADVGRIRGGKLAGKTMWAAIGALSWPVLITSFLDASVGLVATILATGLSVDAADGVGAAAYVVWFAANLALAIGVAATAMVSRAVGRNRLGVANAAVGQCTLLAIVGGLFFAATLFAAAPLFADLMKLKGHARAEAILYLRIAAAGVPLLTFMEASICAIRGAGDAVRPMLTLAAANVVNIVVSFLLSGVDITWSSVDAAGRATRHVLIHNPLSLDLGVKGLAIGTVCAWATAASALLVILVRGTHGLRLRARRMAPHWHTIRRLLAVAVPNFGETFGMWFGNFLTILMVGWMGAEGLYGAHIIAVRIEAFSFLPGFAMALAAATLTGQYLGAGSVALAQRAALRCATIGMLIMGVFGLVFMLAPRPISGLLSSQDVHLHLVPQLLIVCGSAQVPFALATVLRGALRGAGDTLSAMIITIVSTFLIRFPLAWICCGVDMRITDDWIIRNPLGGPLQRMGFDPLVGFWMGLCAELYVRAFLFGLAFWWGRWKRIRI
ncbi:MAG: MATE family efflux transporter [Phycisphaerales bacterium]|nr:MATE family efflux transporter [Phycisphaerales bacterium]